MRDEKLAEIMQLVKDATPKRRATDQEPGIHPGIHLHFTGPIVVTYDGLRELITFFEQKRRASRAP